MPYLRYELNNQHIANAKSRTTMPTTTKYHGIKHANAEWGDRVEEEWNVQKGNPSFVDEKFFGKK